MKLFIRDSDFVSDARNRYTRNVLDHVMREGRTRDDETIHATSACVIQVEGGDEGRAGVSLTDIRVSRP